MLQTSADECNSNSIITMYGKIATTLCIDAMVTSLSNSGYILAIRETEMMKIRVYVTLYDNTPGVLYLNGHP